jgi:formate dehydrogenase subunit gamma
MTVATGAGRSDVIGREGVEAAAPAERLISRYGLFERVLHWEVAITFIALMLSGMALAYPRLAWLSGLFGGGQTMRAAHPWIGIAFTVGIVTMLVIWGRQMLLDKGDRLWFRRMGAYARTGHIGLDTGRWNGGQKGYFWASLVLGIVLLLTGIPLWFPSVAGTGIREWSRLIHHAAYLVMVGGFIIHVLLVFLFPGSLAGMTNGRVTRSWAAWHHPRWYREAMHAESGAPEAQSVVGAGTADAAGAAGPAEPAP